MEGKRKGFNRLLFMGDPEEQAQFVKEHQLFLEKFLQLNDTLDVAFNRGFDPPLSTWVDKFVFTLGLSCAEDFSEILLLCGNGYGVGGQKILRGMFERAVTAWHLHLHPEEAKDFFDFGKISLFRSMKKLEDIFGKDIYDGRPDYRENFEEMKKAYNEVKDRFTITACSKCKTKKLNYTWNKLDFVSMAKKVPLLGDPFLIRMAYDEPTQQAHATLRAIATKTSAKGEGRRNFGRVLDRERVAVKNTLNIAHLIILSILSLQHKHFKLTFLDPFLQGCLEDYKEIWPSPHFENTAS